MCNFANQFQVINFSKFCKIICSFYVFVYAKYTTYLALPIGHAPTELTNGDRKRSKF